MNPTVCFFLVLASFFPNIYNNPQSIIINRRRDRTHFHNDEVNDEHFPFVIELGDVDPAEMVSPAAVVERRDAAVIRPDVQSGPSRVLKTVNIYFKCKKINDKQV